MLTRRARPHRFRQNSDRPCDKRFARRSDAAVRAVLRSRDRPGRVEVPPGVLALHDPGSSSSFRGHRRFQNEHPTKTGTGEPPVRDGANGRSTSFVRSLADHGMHDCSQKLRPGDY
jgi:hypothetical protein